MARGINTNSACGSTFAAYRRSARNGRRAIRTPKGTVGRFAAMYRLPSPLHDRKRLHNRRSEKLYKVGLMEALIAVGVPSQDPSLPTILPASIRRN
jgi:hypothetical protein